MDEKKKRAIEEIAKIIYKDFQAPSRYIAEQIYNVGYRKESDTARDILTELLNMGERAILNDIINPYECFFVSFDKFKKFAQKYSVDLGE